jgi:thioredoxin-like negative regulator of GroEL
VPCQIPTGNSEVFSMVDKTTDATFDQDVLKASGPVVVDFWAEW